MPGYGHFQADCPNGKVLTIKEIEDLDKMEIEEDEKESKEEEENFYLPPEEEEMLMIKRVPHAIEALPEANQREQIFHSRCKVANKT